MNARVYDPELGRFLAADTVTPSIYLIQALNRYAYVGNNPLSRTDPTGHSWLSKLFRKVPILRAIFQLALAITLQSFFALPAIGLATDSAANVFLSASISSGTSGGSLKAALIGGVQALAFHGVGVFKGLAGIKNGSPGSAVLHGLVGGLASEAQGGKFIQGFLAAGFGDLAGNIPIAKGGGRITAFRAIVGGIAAELGGGKFVNGAVTAAFGYIYNDLISCDVGADYSGCIRIKQGGPDEVVLKIDGNIVAEYISDRNSSSLSDEEVGENASKAYWASGQAVDPLKVVTLTWNQYYDLSVNQMNMQIRRGQALDTIRRIDRKSGERGSDDEAEFVGGGSLKRSGEWKHPRPGGNNVSRAEEKWLREWGWNI